MWPWHLVSGFDFCGGIPVSYTKYGLLHCMLLFSLSTLSELYWDITVTQYSTDTLLTYLILFFCCWWCHLLQTVVQGESLARGPKLLSLYTVEQCGFLIHKYWQTGSFKACQMAFRMEFDERHAPSKRCIQKLVIKLKTRESRSNACWLLSLGSIEGQSVKNTPHTIEQLKDAIRQEIQAVNFDTLGKVFQSLAKRIQVCLDVKGGQLQHRLWADPVLHLSRYVYINFQVIFSVT